MKRRHRLISTQAKSNTQPANALPGHLEWIYTYVRVDNVDTASTFTFYVYLPTTRRAPLFFQLDTGSESAAVVKEIKSYV